MMRKASNRKVMGRVVLALCAAIASSGCIQSLPTASNTPLTPEEERMREQGDAFNKTVIEGAALGALAGAVAGVLIKRDAKGALAGAAIGGLLGGSTGYYLAQKQKKYVSAEQRLDAMIADVRADNERVASLIATSKKVIAADMQKIKELEKQIAAGNISKEKARRELASIEENEKYLIKTISNLEKRQDEWESISAQTEGQASAHQKRAMNHEISKLEKQIASLEKELDTLVQRRKILPVA